MRALIAVAWIVLLLAGRGGGGGASAASPPAKRSDRLVDFSMKPPYVNALDVDPDTGDYLLTTNRGFYRIGADGGQVTRVQGRSARAPRARRWARSSSCSRPVRGDCSAPATPTRTARCRRSWA